jgi:hypothetical protein
MKNEKNQQVVNTMALALSGGTRFCLNQFLPTETRAEFNKEVATFFFDKAKNSTGDESM